jgi:hypothetical protein
MEQTLVLHGEETEGSGAVDLQEWFQSLYQFAQELGSVGDQMQKEEDQTRLKQMKNDETKVGGGGWWWWQQQRQQ